MYHISRVHCSSFYTNLRDFNKLPCGPSWLMFKCPWALTWVTTVVAYGNKHNIGVFRSWLPAGWALEALYTVNCEYFMSKIFRAIIFRVIYFGQTILYRIIINIAHVFCAFKFHTSQPVQKYFNNEIFTIYGSRFLTEL